MVLTARYEDKGHEAIERLKECGLSNLVIYHQLDVTDSASIASLVDFVKSQFGKLDILVRKHADMILNILKSQQWNSFSVSHFFFFQ